MGQWGIEAQFWRNEEFEFSRRFDHSNYNCALARALATAWAQETREGIEAGHDRTWTHGLRR
jgi:hypothetical protein